MYDRPAIKKTYAILQIVPLSGSILYSLLYFIATLFYPGGNYENKNAVGFNWQHNYWCNLLAENALNGQPNPARPVAFAAMIVICFTLIIFWFLFPKHAGFTPVQSRIIQLSGVLAMVTGSFIFTAYHDSVINVAGTFGLICLAGTLIGLRKLHWMKLFWSGILVMLLVLLNNFIYYGQVWMYYLPVVQKISFVVFLLWISMINVYWLKKREPYAADMIYAGSADN